MYPRSMCSLGANPDGLPGLYRRAASRVVVLQAWLTPLVTVHINLYSYLSFRYGSVQVRLQHITLWVYATNDVPVWSYQQTIHTVYTDAVCSTLHNKHTRKTQHQHINIYVTSYDIRMHVYLTIQTTEKRSVYNTAFIIYNITYWDVTPVSTHSSTCIVAAKAWLKQPCVSLYWQHNSRYMKVRYTPCSQSLMTPIHHIPYA